MKDNAHPESAGENGDDSGDEAGNDSDAECVHGAKINLPPLEFAAGIVDHKSIYVWRLSFRNSDYFPSHATICLSSA